MFPLCDQRGRVLGFGARAMGADQKPKYLNSSDNVVFHKGRHLFGADIARAPAAKAGEVIVAEGYTDVIAMHQAGLRHTVGLMGTALTEEQVGELARLAPTVLLALDADAAGQEAMLRGARVAARRNLDAARRAAAAGQRPRRPRGAAEGARAMADRVEASVPFVRFRVERELAAGGPRERRGQGRASIARAAAGVRRAPGQRDARGAHRAGGRPHRARAGARGLVAGRRGRRASAQTGASGGNGASQRRPAVPQPALDAAGRAERAFLAQCLASPVAGREALGDMDIDAEFSTDLMRRAAVHVHAPAARRRPRASARR